MTLDGYDGPENVAILMAEARGYFEDVGLKMVVTVPVVPARPLPYLTQEAVTLAVSHQPEIVIAKGKQQSRPVVAIGSLISQPTAAMIWLKKSNIHQLADLKGKVIAVPGLYFQKAFLESVLAQGGLTPDDVIVKRVDYQAVSMLEDGSADAIFGASANLEGAVLEARGFDPVITPVSELGVPDYDELVVIARPETLAEDPQLASDFMSALERGAEAAVESPLGAVEAIERSAEKDAQLSRAETWATVKATLPLLSTTGRVSYSHTSHLVDWMYREGMIAREPPPSTLLTNDFLP